MVTVPPALNPIEEDADEDDKEKCAKCGTQGNKYSYALGMSAI